MVLFLTFIHTFIKLLRHYFFYDMIFCESVEPYNQTSSNIWENRGAAPALPESLRLYNKLLSLGIKIAFITGRPESRRNITAYNLKKAGYQTWDKLILK